MGTNLINLGIRFLLELAALFSMGYWGWRQGIGAFRVLLAVGIPILAAVVWGIFNVPKDPSRSGRAPVPVPGIVRLILELVFFGAAIWMLYAVGAIVPSLLMGLATISHYAISYDRLRWLLRW